MELFLRYKKKIASRFIPIEGHDAVKEIPEADEYIYSEKIDGHIGFALVANNEVRFYNRSGNKMNLPALEDAFPKSAEGMWAGELYLKRERSRSFDVASALVNAKDEICFAVFDDINLAFEDVQADDRTIVVTEKIPVGEKVHPVVWHKTTSRKELVEKYEEAMQSGKEGLVVHTKLGYTYKLKAQVNLDLTVIAYSLKEEGTGIRSLLVGYLQDDAWVVAGSVGGGYSEEDRATWMNRLVNMNCESDVVLVASNRLAYKWVTPQIVVQVKCLEILNEDSSGEILKDSLVFENGGYKANGKISGISLVSPVFIGERLDKHADHDDTGVKQITDRVEILKSENMLSLTLPKSEIILREVYIKELKGQTAVRKFIGVRTNKSLKERFPKYYFYYTDFSAGRKDPLQTDIKIMSTEDILRETFAKYIEEYVKKGWEKV